MCNTSDVLWEAFSLRILIYVKLKILITDWSTWKSTVSYIDFQRETFHEIWFISTCVSWKSLFSSTMCRKSVSCWVETALWTNTRLQVGLLLLFIYCVSSCRRRSDGSYTLACKHFITKVQIINLTNAWVNAVFIIYHSSLTNDRVLYSHLQMIS